jgi:hypothetical protein
VSEILSQVPSQQLDEIVLDFVFDPEEDLVFPGLSEVDEALQCPSFLTLKKVEVRCLWTRWPDMPGPDFSEEIMDDMPQCLARGILYISQVEFPGNHYL